MNKRSFSEKIVSKNKSRKGIIFKETAISLNDNHNCK